MRRRYALPRWPAVTAAACWLAAACFWAGGAGAALFWPAADAAAEPRGESNAASAQETGGQPTLPDIPAPLRRVVTLAPHITELIFAAGAGERIVGTVDSSDYPPAARTIPRIGDGVSISVEQTVALRPQAVIAWLPTGSVRALTPALNRLGIALLYSQPLKLDDIPAEIVRYGRLFGTPGPSQAAAHALGRRIADLRQRYAGRKPVSAFVEIGSAPLFTIGRDPLLNDVLAACGGVNIYAGLPMPAARVNPESVLLENPQVIIGPSAEPAELEEIRSRWSTLRLPAATAGRVYGIDPDALFRPGPRLVDAAEALCRYLDQAR
jgi:iron complex transport system substrate-binding protein/vitamin B12 transport system substrate-binding protein